MTVCMAKERLAWLPGVDPLALAPATQGDRPKVRPLGVPRAPPMLLLIDHRDSFTFNLAQSFAGLGAEVRVASAENLSAEEVFGLDPASIVLGPGPGPPDRAELAHRVVREARVPVLGVCLGHQVLAQAFGARIVRGARPIHGHSALLKHPGTGLFQGLPDPLEVGRYHSLVVDPASLPEDELEVTARDLEGGVQGLRHRTRPLFGVQFHPESILSPGGSQVLQNFLRLTGLAEAPPG